MAIRMRKRIKLFPGVYINLSKSGISTSIGMRGASITLGHGKTRTNVGVLGTGISYNSINQNNPKPTQQSSDGISMIKLFAYGIGCLGILIVLLGLFGAI
jgi:hypothetical protein